MDSLKTRITLLVIEWFCVGLIIGNGIWNNNPKSKIVISLLLLAVVIIAALLPISKKEINSNDIR
jgi:hypothetical protein